MPRRRRRSGSASGRSAAGGGAMPRRGWRGWSTGGSASRRRGGRRRTSCSGCCKLYHEHYAGFAIRHFHDTLRRRHGYKLGYTTTRLWLQRSGAVAAAPKRGAHRRKRPRRPMVGMMLHQDGSTHAWLVGQPPLDLVITLDDATSAIYSAVLVEEEGTASTFSRPGRGDRAARPVHRALHRPRQPLLPHAARPAGRSPRPS